MNYIELLKRSLIDTLGPTTSRVISNGDGTVRAEEVPEQERHHRFKGEDWPLNAATMIGYDRLSNLQMCIQSVVEQDIPGDLIETGVWRGGAVIFARAVLDSLGDHRTVWALDSFGGLPAGDGKKYPSDDGDMHHTVDYLRASEHEVRLNFARYAIPTQGVHFVPGWFRDTLPLLGGERWAIVRLDGDMYESTTLGFNYLYPSLSDGGFVIVDDYGAVQGCREATDDYRKLHGIDETAHEIDWTGIYWRK